MKRLFFVLTVVLAVVVTSCNKTEEVSPVSKDDSGIVKSNPTPRPLSGWTEGECTFISGAYPNPVVHKLFTGQGIVSHFGNSTMTFDFSYITTNLNPAADSNGIVLAGAFGSIIGANGDQCNFVTVPVGNVPAPYVGTYKFGGWVPAPPLPFYLPTTNEMFPATCNIIGGTGRFADASGTFQAWGIQWDIATGWPPDYTIPIPTKFWLEGTIIY
jgi:hypothetical protein